MWISFLVYGLNVVMYYEPLQFIIILSIRHWCIYILIYQYIHVFHYINYILLLKKNMKQRIFDYHDNGLFSHYALIMNLYWMFE
jgi:hypothetical protein